MEHYLNLQITPKLILSPFRDDNKPTCGFYYGNSQRLYLHDFATDEHMDVITIVQKKYNCTYYKAVQQITADYLKFSATEKVSLNEDKKLEWVVGNGDLSYFDRYYIKPTTLTKFGVYSCRALYIDEDLYWRSTTNNPIFVYQFLSKRFKAYRPLSPDKTKKWKSTCKITDVQGWPQLKAKGKLVFITSSLKDVMVLYQLGYPAIAFNSEGIPTRGESAVTVEEVITQLKDRFERVILFLDNDVAGVNYSKKLAKRYNLPYIVLPDGPKDISDHIHKYNKRKTKRTLNKLISKLVTNESKPVEYLDLAATINDSILRSTDVEPGHVVSES